MNDFLQYTLIDHSGYKLTVFNLLVAFLVFVIGRILINVITHLIRRYLGRKKVDTGRVYAIIQFSKYVFYFILLIAVLEAVGVSFTLIWGGAAALLVGIGLGLQQTFQDLFSGIVLLIEGTITVGDIVEVDDKVVKVLGIGIRTSKVVTRDNIVIIIPNSKLVTESVVNWSNNNETSRFKVEIGVSYGSNIELVEKLLYQSLDNHAAVLEDPKPDVQFIGYGDSSLNFNLYFHSLEFFGIEKVKSELRKNILALFRANKVEIPFPQRDVWFKNDLHQAREENEKPA